MAKRHTPLKSQRLGSASQTGPLPANPEVTVARPLLLPIVERDEYIGRLEAIDTVEVRARVSGHLNPAHFEEGQLMKQGDLLAIVDPHPFAAKLSAAKASEQKAVARFSESNSLFKQAIAEKVDSQAQLKLANTQPEERRNS